MVAKYLPSAIVLVLLVLVLLWHALVKRREGGREREQEKPKEQECVFKGLLFQRRPLSRRLEWQRVSCWTCA